VSYNTIFFDFFFFHFRAFYRHLFVLTTKIIFSTQMARERKVGARERTT
jgi:hypothetical protein